jgi:hypothetical protein
VQRFEEMVRLQLELHVFDQAIVDHQRAQKGGFRFDILRQCRCSRRLGGLGDTDYFGHDSSWPVSGHPPTRTKVAQGPPPVDRMWAVCGAGWAGLAYLTAAPHPQKKETAD